MSRNTSTFVRGWLRSFATILTAGALFCTTAAFAADYDTWNGSVNGLWSNNGNWTPDAANEFPSGQLGPLGLIFESGSGFPTSTNDLVGKSFDGILIFGSGFDLRGNQFGIETVIDASLTSGTFATIENPITFATAGAKIMVPIANTSLGLTGPLTINNIALTVTNAGMLEMGALSGAGVYSINFTGPGLNQLQGNVNSFASTLSFSSASSVQIFGAFSNAQFNVNGTMYGGGTVGRVALTGAMLYPGYNFATGQMTVVSNLTADSATKMNFRLQGSVPGANYDQIVVTATSGTLSLGSCQLQLQPSGTPVAGTSYTLIQMPGTTKVTGTFSGWPEGGEQLIGNAFYVITYKGGDGNDVVLTVTNAAAVWKGSTTSTAWSLASNWSNNIPPSTGYDVIFPASPLNFTSQNNILLGSYDHVIFQGSGYHVNGLVFSIAGGIMDSNNGLSFTTFDTGLGLSASQTFTENGLALLITNLMPGTNTLTLAGSGSYQFTTIQGGTGAIIVSNTVLVLFGTNTFAGQYYVPSGRITMNTGDNSASSGILVTNTGNVLIGSASVSPSLTVNSPGASFNPAGTFGVCNIAGSLNMIQGSVSFTINSTNAYRIRPTGGITITTNFMLGLGGAFLPSPGQSLVIFDNAGPNPINGQFQNLPESGTFFTIGNPLPYRISYAGGDGNDISITAIPIPHVWNGTPSSGLWSTAADWQSNSPPGVGDGMVFPAFASGLAATNDFPAFMRFESLTVSNLYTFYGNPVALTGGFVLASSAVFNPALRLLSNQVWNVQSNFVVNGAVDLTNSLLSFAGSGSVVFSNNVTGTNGGSIVSAGGLSSLTFCGTNNYSGLTRVHGGMVTFENGPFLNSPIQIEQADCIVTNGVLVSNSAVSFTGGVSNVADFNGTLVNGSLAVSNGTFLVATNASVSNSPTSITGGTLVVAGQMPFSPITMSGGTLSGSGIVTNVTAIGGTIAPGPGFGQLLTGTLSIGSNAAVQLKLAGKIPGTNQDQLKVTGTVNLTNTMLNLLLTDQTLNLGDTVVLIANDGAEPINGTFAGLPEGTTFPLGLLNVQISYVGGTGNDVTLTVVAQIQRATWTGAGSTNTWSTPTNWARSTLPLAGDSLYFPAAASNLANVNDLSATNYAAIVLTSSNYFIEASNVTFATGIIAANPSGTNMVDSAQFGGASVISNAAGNTLVLTGVVSNAPLNFLAFGDVQYRGEMATGSNLVMAGTGTLELFDTNPIFRGDIILQSGLTDANTAAALGVSSGAQSISIFTGATLALNTNGEYGQQFSVGGTLHVTSAGTLSDSGGAVLGTNGTYLVDAGASLTASGIIGGTGSAGLIKDGPGEMTMLSTNTYSGDTLVRAGTLYISGLSFAPPAAAVSVSAGATLRGGGPAGPLFVNEGVLAPGFKTSHAVLQPHDGVSLTSGSTYEIRLSDVPEGYYDSMSVDGPVVLASPALQLVLDFLPPVNSTFTIITNDGTEPIFGEFNGIAQNGFYTNGPAVFRVNYQGGSGNDVVLTTDHYTSTGNTRVWTGAGTNAFWSTAQNWSGGTAPQSGDALAFPPGALQLNNTNNFGTNTYFEAITIGGVNYRLNGNPISVLGGCSATNTSGTNTLALPISILTDTSISCQQSGATLAFDAPLNSNSRTISFAGSGTVLGIAPVIGFGGINQTGPGLAELHGTNTYSGQTEVSGGRLRFQDSTLGQDGGEAVVTNGAILELSDTTNVVEDFTICGTVVFTNAPSFNVTGNFDFPTNCGGTFDVASGALANIFATFSSDGGGPIKEGLGDLQIVASDLTKDAYSGPAEINAGRLIFNDQTKGLTSTFGDIVVNFGATLAVTGLVNRVIVNPGGTLAPGLFSGIGPVNMQKDLILAPDAIVMFDLQGITPIIDFDSITVQGAVNLSNATLQVALDYDAVQESQFQIIGKTSAGAVTGIFSGLPEGSIFTTTNGSFQITYAGGDGNDVVLTRVDTPPEIMSFTSLPGGCKELTCTAQNGSFIIIQATENLAPPISWEVLDVQMTDGTGKVQFIDTDATNHPMRFYRILSP